MSSEHDGRSSAPPDLPKRSPPTEDPEHRDDGLDLAGDADAGHRALDPSRPDHAASSPGLPRPAAGCPVPTPTTLRDPQLLDTTLHRLVDDHGWGARPACTASSAGGRSWSAPRWPSTAPPSPSPTGGWWCVPTRPPGPPGACACSRRGRPPPQRGARARHGHRHRRAGPAPADLDQGSLDRSATAVGRGTPTAEHASAPTGSPQRSGGRFDVRGLSAPLRDLRSPLTRRSRTLFHPQTPPAGGCRVEYGLWRAIMGLGRSAPGTRPSPCQDSPDRQPENSRRRGARERRQPVDPDETPTAPPAVSNRVETEYDASAIQVRGARGGPQAPRHVHRLHRRARPAPPDLGDRGQRGRRGPRRLLRPIVSTLNADGGTGRRQRSRHPDRHRAARSCPRDPGAHGPARRRQVRRWRLQGVRWPARGRRLRSSTPLRPVVAEGQEPRPPVAAEPSPSAARTAPGGPSARWSRASAPAPRSRSGPPRHLRDHVVPSETITSRIRDGLPQQGPEHRRARRRPPQGRRARRRGRGRHASPTTSTRTGHDSIKRPRPAARSRCSVRPRAGRLRRHPQPQKQASNPIISFEARPRTTVETT